MADAGIDLAQIEDWHEFCRLKDLRYDRVLDDPGLKLRDVLAEVAAAGRATPRHDGVRWGVTIDRPQELLVDHLTPRNSWAFKASRTYTRPPHAFRVRFNDAAADYASRERLILWPGHSGEVTLTEELDLPGKTRAAEVWREARRRMLEAIHRPDVFEAMQDGPVRVATRGDRIALSQDVLDGFQAAARVVAVRGREIELDDEVQVTAGVDHVIRFRSLSPADTVGTSQLRAVSAPVGLTRVLALAEGGAAPAEGDLVLFGRAGSESHALIVTGIEMGEDMTCLLRAVAAAPEIDATLDATAVPAWSSRVGKELARGDLAPPEPRFAGVDTGAAGTGERQAVEIDLTPGPGSVPTVRYALRHRLSGAGAWNTLYAPAADGGFRLTSYVTGSSLELQAAALSADGVAGPWTAILPVAVGSGDAALPAAIDPADVTVTPMPGGARVDFATGADAAAVAVQLYCSTGDTLDRAADAVGGPVTVRASRRYTAVIGDGTRINLIRNGDMAAGAAWSAGTGWTVAGGVAGHGAGDATALTQSVALAAGKVYRLGYTAALSAGSVRPQITGTTTRSGAIRSAPGRWTDRIQAVTGNNALRFLADVDFAGSIDDVLLFAETATCLSQGAHNIWLEPINRDGIPGPVTGPIPVIVE